MKQYASELPPVDFTVPVLAAAMNPRAITDQLSEANQRALSDFERDVIRELTAKDYRLATQWPVGAYSIDIVVLGDDGHKVAIECDGDKHHRAPEKVDEDLKRQLRLERRGWRFIRIRSTKFYMNPDETIKQVCSRLESLGIQRIGPVTTSPEPSAQADELQLRIVRCAEPLREQWKADSDIEEEYKKQRAEKKKRFQKAPRPIDAAMQESTIQDKPAIQTPAPENDDRVQPVDSQVPRVHSPIVPAQVIPTVMDEPISIPTVIAAQPLFYSELSKIADAMFRDRQREWSGYELQKKAEISPAQWQEVEKELLGWGVAKVQFGRFKLAVNVLGRGDGPPPSPLSRENLEVLKIDSRTWLQIAGWDHPKFHSLFRWSAYWLGVCGSASTLAIWATRQEVVAKTRYHTSTTFLRNTLKSCEK